MLSPNSKHTLSLILAGLIVASTVASSLFSACQGPPVDAIETVATVVDRDWSQRELLVTLNEADAAELAELTHSQVGNAIEVRIDDVVVITPRIREPIDTGELRITWIDDALTHQLEKIIGSREAVSLSIRVLR